MQDPKKVESNSRPDIGGEDEDEDEDVDLAALGEDYGSDVSLDLDDDDEDASDGDGALGEDAGADDGSGGIFGASDEFGPEWEEEEEDTAGKSKKWKERRQRKTGPFRGKKPPSDTKSSQSSSSRPPDASEHQVQGLPNNPAEASSWKAPKHGDEGQKTTETKKPEMKPKEPVSWDSIVRCTNNQGELVRFSLFRRLGRSYNENYGTCSLRASFSWELVQFCEAELDGFPDPNLADKVPQLLTFTQRSGWDSGVQAATCKDYTRLTWGSRGEQILRLILTVGLEEGRCQFVSPDLRFTVSFHSESDAQTARLDVQGRPRDVADALEQFAWLAATFRPTSAQPTSEKYPLRSSWETVDVDGELGLGPFPLLPLDLYRPSCWTSIIYSVVVAGGFPITHRDVPGIGLEIPFEIMASLARVSALTEIAGRQVLVGPSIVLFPSKVLSISSSGSPTAVQWHCIRSDALAHPDTDRVLQRFANSGEPNLRIADLAGSRCFLGYFEQATVHLGTDAPTQENIVPLGLPKSGQTIQLAREGTFSLGFSIPGIITGNIGGKFLLPRSLRVARSDGKEYEDLLTDSRNQPVVLYDVTAQTGWLVSELSIVLHLCLTYLSMPDTQLRFRGNVPQLPLATATSDGAAAAFDTILTHGHLKLWETAQGGEYKTFHSVVGDFLRDVRTLRNASLLQERSSVTSALFPGLKGWEFADIVNKRDDFEEKKLPNNMAIPSWSALCEGQTIYTIFHRGFGQIIRPASNVSPGWQSVLGGANLLVASMVCIRRLHDDTKHPGREGCPSYHVTKNMALDLKSSRCSLCKDSTAEVIRSLRNCYWYGFPNNESRALSGLPSDHGAVILGDHSSFHAAVEKLSQGTRRLDKYLKAC